MNPCEPSRIERVVDAALYHARFLPALPASAWWILWGVCCALVVVGSIAQIVIAESWRALNVLACFGFCLLGLTPTLRVSYRVRIPALYGEMWIPLDERFLARAIADTRVTHLERVETRDGRIRRVESLPLPHR